MKGFFCFEPPCYIIPAQTVGRAACRKLRFLLFPPVLLLLLLLSHNLFLLKYQRHFKKRVIETIISRLPEFQQAGCEKGGGVFEFLTRVERSSRGAGSHGNHIVNRKCSMNSEPATFTT